MRRPNLKELLITSVFMGILLFPETSQAQTSDRPVLNEISVTNWFNPYQPTPNQTGTPFFYNEWLPGTIHTISGHDYEGITVKLDLVNGRLFVKQSKDPNPRMMNAVHVSSFSIAHADSTYIFNRHLVPVAEVQNPMGVFFIELVSGEFYLLARPDKDTQFEDKNLLAQENDKRDVKYVDVVNYYIKDPEGRITPFKNSKKIKTRIFGDRLSALDKYAKQNKLRWGRPGDLTRIIEQANQL